MFVSIIGLSAPNHFQTKRHLQRLRSNALPQVLKQCSPCRNLQPQCCIPGLLLTGGASHPCPAERDGRAGAVGQLQGEGAVPGPDRSPRCHAAQWAGGPAAEGGFSARAVPLFLAVICWILLPGFLLHRRKIPPSVSKEDL